jgi:hypothetical protein
MRVKELRDGDVFTTLLTRRRGRVFSVFPGTERVSLLYHACVGVKFEDGEVKFLHPEVEVKRVEDVQAAERPSERTASQEDPR